MPRWMVGLTIVLVGTANAQVSKPITDWLVCGPFPFERHQLPQFFTDYLGEHGGETKIAPKEGMQHSVKDLGKVAWQRHQSPDGFLDFVSLLAKPKGEERPRYWQFRYGLAYAYTEIVSDRPQRALLLFGSEDWIAVWLNGELVHESFVYRHCIPEKDAVLVNLREGTNRLLVKVARIAGGWGLSAKIVMPIKRKIFVKAERYGCPPDGNIFVPEIREGETVPVWGYVTVVNMNEQTLPFVNARVRENQWFSEARGQIGDLASGESSQLPFLVAPKRALNPNEKPRLHLVVSTTGEKQEFDLPITVRRKDEPFFTTHRSRLDSSVQPMTLLVPPDYEPQRTYPLVVALHGAKGCLIGHAFSVKTDFIILAPHGRGQTGYRNFGEVDVFEAMDEVRRRYRIDEERIYLTGHSMGGGGTFHLATRHPHRWAAIVPMASRGARPLEWQQNLLHIPTLFYHGGEDEVVPVSMAREAADYLKRLGYNFRYEEVPGKPHWWGVDFPEVFAFFAGHRRIQAPNRIVFWTDDPRTHRAYWLEIADFEDYTKPASVKAGTTREGQGTRLMLATENVTEVVLHLNEAPEALRQLPLTVEWNGCRAVVTRWTTPEILRLRLKPPFLWILVSEEAGDVPWLVPFALGMPQKVAQALSALKETVPTEQLLKSLGRKPQRRLMNSVWQWQRDGVPVFIAEEECVTFPLAIWLLVGQKGVWSMAVLERFVPPKTPKRCGPVTDVFTAPFIVAYDEHSEGAKWAARQFQRWWQNHALGFCRLVAFGDAGELGQMMETVSDSAHLVVFQRVAADARYGSIKFEPKGVRIGKQHLKGRALAVRALLPNPFNPQHYLLINASASEEGLRLLSRVPMDIGQPYDYLVADERFLREGIKGLQAVGMFSARKER